MSDSTTVPSSEKKIGGYEIVQKLGAGGMGSVYKARDPSLDRFVAIKVLSPALEDDPICVERFKREARTIANLRHPNLMHIYTVGTDRGIHYFAMEYIEGLTLSAYLKEHGALPVEEAIRIVGQVICALDKTHNADVVHRDLKPGNIMLDADGRAIVLDFGLSKDTTALNLTTTGAVMGTPDYMAPEQIEGEEVGPYTDVYSLGIILYELLAGKTPFRRKSAVMTMRAHCEEEPDPISSLRQGLSPALADVIHKAMSRDAAKRYDSMKEFGEALADICMTPELADMLNAPSRMFSRTKLPPGVSATADTLPSATVAPTIPRKKSQPGKVSEVLQDETVAHVSGSGKQRTRRNKKTAAKKTGAKASKPAAKARASTAEAEANRRRMILIGCIVGGALLMAIVAFLLLRRGRQRKPSPSPTVVQTPDTPPTSMPVEPAPAVPEPNPMPEPEPVPVAVGPAPDPTPELVRPEDLREELYEPGEQYGYAVGVSHARVRIILHNENVIPAELIEMKPEGVRVRRDIDAQEVTLPLSDIRAILPAERPKR